MSVLIWIDRLFSKSLSTMFLFIFFSMVFFLGIASIPWTYVGFFEYKENLWDLSNVEIGYLLLLSAVIYRHISYSIKYKIGLWNAFSRPLFALGFLTLLMLAYTGMIAIIITTGTYTDDIDLYTAPSDALVWGDGELYGLAQLFWLGVTLLATYLSTPVSYEKRMTSKQSPQSDAGSDNNTDREQEYQEEKSI